MSGPVVNERNHLPDERKNLMKKAMMIKKLEIAKETLRRLDNKELREAAGGSGGGGADTQQRLPPRDESLPLIEPGVRWIDFQRAPRLSPGRRPQLGS